MAIRVTYAKVAADLRDAIDRGDYAAGEVLPREVDLARRYGLDRRTVRLATTLLTAQGYVRPVNRRGTVVRDRSPIRLPLSRYSGVLRPGDHGGPFESATGGRMVTVAVERQRPSADVAAALEISGRARVVYRQRHAMLGEDLVQIQDAWLPARVADGTPLAGGDKVAGGTYAALTAAGHPPGTVDETVTARLPSADEAAAFGIGASTPLLVLRRITRGRDRTVLAATTSRVLELLHITAVGDRAVFGSLRCCAGRRTART